MTAAMRGEGGELVGSGAPPRSSVITKILNFSPDRALTFAPSRSLSFDYNRELIFDPSRQLSFQAWRKMPFGQAGVFFRGYICPSCRRVALPGTTNCQWCKATFDEPLFYIREDIAQDIREWKGRSTIALCGACGLRNPSDAKFCIECGVTMREKPAKQTRTAAAPTGLAKKAAVAKKTARSRVVR